MAEVLGIVANIIAVIQITDTVLSYSYQFIGKVRGAEREVNQIISIITALKGFLEYLQTFIENDENKDQLPLECRYSIAHINVALEEKL